MDYLRLHPWLVDIDSARRIQKQLLSRLTLKPAFSKIERIAGIDASLRDNQLIAAVVILSFPDLKVVEKKVARVQVKFPYVPGLLSFREGPAILKAFSRVKENADILIFDGQGIAHPRLMGIATHLGILLDKPAIGCAKSLLTGEYRVPGRGRGSYSYISIGSLIVGAALRTRRGVKPVFVSPGFKIDLENSLKLILELSRKYRLPEPIRLAHRLAGKDA